jgi:lysophospholipase L1-like esterase
LVGLGLLAALTAGAVWFAFRPAPVPPVSDAVANYTAPPPSAAPATPIAIMFGDSYFNGWGGVPKDYALGYGAARKLGYMPAIRGGGSTGYITARPEGKAGGPLGSFLDQVKGDPLTQMKSAALVVLQGGLADLDADPDAFSEGVRLMIQTVKAEQPSAQIVVLGPPNITPRVEKSGNDGLQAAVAAEMGVAYLSFDALASAPELRPMIGPDKTHPTPEANQVLIDRLAAALVKLGVPDHTKD